MFFAGGGFLLPLIINVIDDEGVRWPPLAFINCIDDEGVAIQTPKEKVLPVDVLFVNPSSLLFCKQNGQRWIRLFKGLVDLFSQVKPKRIPQL